MDEAKACYQYVYGLAPTGPHRPMASRLFENTRRRCESCNGEGVLGPDEHSWTVCATCEGTGGFWVIGPSEVEAIRRRILEAYPQAAAPAGPIHFLSGRLVQDLSTGLMYDVGDGAAPVRRADPEEED
jgi:hypothetical protein